MNLIEFIDLESLKLITIVLLFYFVFKKVKHTSSQNNKKDLRKSIALAYLLSKNVQHKNILAIAGEVVDSMYDELLSYDDFVEKIEHILFEQFGDRASKENIKEILLLFDIDSL